MARRKLTFILAVTAIALQPDVAHSFPSQRYSPDLIQLGRQNAVDTPESNMYRYLKQMELEQILQRQYSPDSPINSEVDDLGIVISPKVAPEKELEDITELALEQSKVDARENNLYRRGYYGKQPGSMYREYNPMHKGGIIFVPEEEQAYARTLALRQGFDTENVRDGNFLERDEEMQERMDGNGMENIGGGYLPERDEDLQDMIRQEEIQEKVAFREVDSLRQQEILEQAIRQEEMFQDITLRQAASLRRINTLREDGVASDPLQQFQIARDAFIYKEEIRQNMLRQQALRQEMLRQEALRQEKVFQEDPERQETTLRQESEILQQLIKQEELRQENARNLENAYREEAAIRQDDIDKEEILLQKAQFQENIRQESEQRQEEAIRQNDILRKKISKILQQVCINCGPKIVSVSHSQHIQI